MTSAFDQVAKSYWQDYKQNRPIGGGMTYEQRVRACHLDGSVNSLKRLDELLAVIKNELVDASEHELLQKVDFRHFVLFLGFYVGWVLQSCTGRALGWVATDPTTPTATERFYQVAMLCPKSDNNPAFFVLLSVGATLFAGGGRTFIDPIQKTHVPQSLYWAFKAYEEALRPPKILQPPQNKPAPQRAINTLSGEVAKTVTGATAEVADGQTHKSINSQTAKPSIDLKAPKKSIKSPQVSKADNNHFSEIERDLATLPAANDIYHAQQCQAMAVLTDIQSPITKDKQMLIRQALQQLQKIATAGNTDAMIQLGLCYFKGRFVKANEQKAVAWVKRAADMNDARAQKLLSRLYYQGSGVELSTEQGLYWLCRAADNGHVEAIKLKQQFDAISAIKDEQRADAKKDKQYLTMFVIVGVIVVFLLWLLVKFAGG